MEGGRSFKASIPKAAAARAYLQAVSDVETAGADSDLAALLPELEEAKAAAARQLLEATETIDREPARLLVEVRKGVGGDEAALWAGSVARMLERFALRHGLEVEEVSLNANRGGGIKERILSVHGPGARSLLEPEAGVHRVQRVSPTDSKGRVHTSAATVAVLLEPEEAEALDLAEVELQYFCASGNGGQNVNKVETAVRARHLPTGMTVSIQDERSQGQNRERALQVLSARVAERRRQEIAAAETVTRRAQLGSGDRSQKMRTYDFPEGLAIDHKSGLKSKRLQEVLDGQLELLRPPA